MAWAQTLIATYLRGRWWRTVEDLLEDSYDAEDLAFDDLEIDGDFEELRRAVSIEHLLAFCENILDREESIPDGDPILEPFAEIPEAGRGFLTLLAINLAIFHLKQPGWAIVARHISNGAKPRFRQPKLFATLLARAAPQRLAKQWLQQHADPTWKEQALLAPPPTLLNPQNTSLLHLPADQKTCQRSLQNLFAKDSLKPCRPEERDIARRLLGYRRAGRFHSFVIAQEDREISMKWAQELSSGRAIGEAVWADHNPENPGLKHFRQAKLVLDEQGLAKKLEIPQIQNSDLIGTLLELGARLYDCQGPRAPEAILGPEATNPNGRLHCYRPAEFAPTQKRQRRKNKGGNRDRR